MAENRYEFRYQAGDVASAQRMRMRGSRQMRVMGLIWLVSSAALVVPLLLPEMFPGSPFASWELVAQIALFYLVTLGVLVLVTPYLDYAFRRFWHMPLQFQFNERSMRMSVVGGKSKGLRLDWDQLLRIEKNKRVYILYYGAGNQFIILPRRIFDERGLERFEGLRQRMEARLASGAAPRPIGAETERAAEVEDDALEDDAAGGPGEAAPTAPTAGKKRSRRRR